MDFWNDMIGKTPIDSPLASENFQMARDKSFSEMLVLSRNAEPSTTKSPERAWLDNKKAPLRIGMPQSSETKV